MKSNSRATFRDVQTIRKARQARAAETKAKMAEYQARMKLEDKIKNLRAELLEAELALARLGK